MRKVGLVLEYLRLNPIFEGVNLQLSMKHNAISPNQLLEENAEWSAEPTDQQIDTERNRILRSLSFPDPNTPLVVTKEELHEGRFDLPLKKQASSKCERTASFQGSEIKESHFLDQKGKTPETNF